eukprot:gene37076-45003_t
MHQVQENAVNTSTNCDLTSPVKVVDQSGADETEDITTKYLEDQTGERSECLDASSLLVEEGRAHAQINQYANSEEEKIEHSELATSLVANVENQLPPEVCAPLVRPLASPEEAFPQDTDEGESDDSLDDDKEASRSNNVGPRSPIDSPGSPEKGSEAQCASPTVAGISSDAGQVKGSGITDINPSGPSSAAGPNTSKSDYETVVKKFGLSVQDKVLESFSCALYPKKGLLAHGRMFIMQHYVAFSGWKDMRVL